MPGTNDFILSDNDHADIIDAGAGDDRIASDGFGDVLIGGDGVDTADIRLRGTVTGVNINIGAQLAQTTVDPLNYYDIGSGTLFLSGIERLFFAGGSGDDVVHGGAYDDRLDGGFGADQIYGEGGNDTLFGHNGNEILDGGLGNDRISVDGHVALIDGGGGVDSLFITGTEGFDAQGHTGEINNVETIYVNAGLNQISFSQVDSGEIIRVLDVSNGLGGWLGAKIIGTEKDDLIYGGKGNDVLNGNKGRDKLFGGDGDDTLIGGVGTDRLFGQDGNDTIIVNSGLGQGPDKIIDGGAGIDKLSLNQRLATAGTLLDLTDPAVAQVVNGVTIVNVEQIGFDGSDLGDIVTGGAYVDGINGFGGNDTIKGAGGDDRLDGGLGTDTAIYSGNFSDYTITQQGAGNNWFIEGTQGAGLADGKDTVLNFEFLQFADGLYAVGAGGVTLVI